MIDLAYYKRINHEFYQRVGVINCVERLNKMGLEPRDIIGTFWLKDMEKLMAICKSNKDLHIITYVNACFTANRFVEGRFRFRLAQGDKDPSIELRFPPEVADHLLAELNHFVRRTGIGF